jgi:hypothetical protein
VCGLYFFLVCDGWSVRVLGHLFPQLLEVKAPENVSILWLAEVGFWFLGHLSPHLLVG